MENDLIKLAENLGKTLKANKLKIVTAESCTGGMVAQTITSVSGSAEWFERGFVTYSNAAKQELLAVHEITLIDHGAVSEPTAREMAKGALKNSHADIAIAVTGIAGPTGGTKFKPVGTVCFAIAQKNQQIISMTEHFDGGREKIRNNATSFLLHEVIATLS